MVNALFVLALASFAALADATFWLTAHRSSPYCNIPSCNGRKHTVCKFPNLRPSLGCGRVQSSVVSDAEIQELIDIHKKYNKNPQARLAWDKELAYVAQTWANQCTFRVDECRNVERFVVGQSYTYSKTTGPFNVRLYELVDSSGIPEGTTLIGCGAIRYNSDRKFNTTFLVCNYASTIY